MRTFAGLMASLALAACAQNSATGDAPQPSSRYAFWRPAPVADAPDPAEAVANAPASAWRRIDPDNLLVLDLAGGGRVAIELAPGFAPVHVANIRALANAGWWNGATIYRVQDNYVVQWGNGDGDLPMPEAVNRTPPAEYTRPLAGLETRPIGFPDSYAPMAGHADGWPIAWDPERGEAWLTHCYGNVGVGRDLSPDTGTGGELYAVIGQAPRQLDRNIATVGRVIDGMQHLTALPRGTGRLGFYDADKAETPVPILRVRLASAIPAAERPAYEVMDTGSSAFTAYVTGRANRGSGFFLRPAGGIDVCNAPVPTRQAG